MRQFSLQPYHPNGSGFSGLHAGRYGLRRNSGRVYSLSPAGENEREADGRGFAGRHIGGGHEVRAAEQCVAAFHTGRRQEGQLPAYHRFRTVRTDSARCSVPAERYALSSTLQRSLRSASIISTVGEIIVRGAGFIPLRIGSFHPSFVQATERAWCL